MKNNEMLVAEYGLRTIGFAKRSNAIVQAYFKKPSGTVEEFSRIAMVSRGTFFNYFENVEHLKRYALVYFILDTKFNTDFEHIGHRVDKLKEYDLFTVWAKVYQDQEALPIPAMCEVNMFINKQITSESQIQEIIDEYASDEAFIEAFLSLAELKHK